MSIENVGKGLRLWVTVCGLVLGGLCLAGCRSQGPKQQSAKVPSSLSATSTASTATSKVAVATPDSESGLVPRASNSAGPEPEVFRIGDSLTITFMDTPSLIPSFEGRIKEDGTITLTLNQSFKADGKTRGDL